MPFQVQESELFTPEKLAESGHGLSRGKAPEPDSEPDEVLWVIVQVRPDLLLQTFNKCLKKRVFLDS